MLIANLQPIKTDLIKLKEIPDTFFLKLEAAVIFDNSLFPEWLTNKKGNPIVFGKNTELRNKFKAIYDKYKAIKVKDERLKIITAYFDTNKISHLCANENHIHCLELNDLHLDIRNEIDEAFLYLYKSALNHPPFEKLVNDTIKTSIRNFIKLNKIDICPFCGLEMFYLIDGQAKLPLDHWLNKDRFPFASINFDNLIPIGTDCNTNGVKGSKNVLRDIKLRPKKRAFYPYAINNGFSISIICTQEPCISNEFGEWDFSVTPTMVNETDFFESWDYLFNITSRYRSFFYEILIPQWKEYYVGFINNVEDGVVAFHAQDIDQFKGNLRQWRKTFVDKKIPASFIYKKFIDYLLNNASEEYLIGEVENFKSKVIAGVI